jgi:endonuclease YncB( thermonuclease family)
MGLLAGVVVALAGHRPADAATPAPIEGPAVAIDGDTLRVATDPVKWSKVRLFGVKAPERETRIGPLATGMLDELIAGRSVSCKVVDIDLYGGATGRCAVLAGPADLSLEMVRAGWAAADRRYTTEYDAAERTARAARRGLWADLPVGVEENWFWEWVERYQTGLAILAAAGLGFLGVTHTQKSTARLARDQRTAEENRETQRRKDESRGLASALRAEIAVINDIIGRQRTAYQKQYVAGEHLNLYSIESLRLLAPVFYPKVTVRLTLLSLLPSASAPMITRTHCLSWSMRGEK